MEHETIQPNKIKMTEKQGCKNKLQTKEVISDLVITELSLTLRNSPRMALRLCAASNG